MAFYAQKDPRIRSRLDATSSEAAKVDEKPKTILEDYLLDDELSSKSSTSKGPKTPPMPAAGNSWQSVPPTTPGSDIKTTPQQVYPKSQITFTKIKYVQFTSSNYRW